MTKKFEEQLEDIDEERRGVLIKLARLTAFAVPVIATFAIDGRLSVASAQQSNTETR